MSHDHAKGQSNRRRLMIAIAIVASVLLIESVGAVLSGSLSLLADAGHMLSDLLGLVIALVATIVSARPATARQTFGYQRAEVFGALVNGLILLVVAVVVTIGAVGRLTNPNRLDVNGDLMLWVAVIGLLANTTALLVLRSSAKSSINMKGAYLEVLGDVLGSIAVIAAALVLIFTGFEEADAIASLLIAAMIIPRAVTLLRDVVRVLSEGVPKDTDLSEIRSHILRTPGVVDVHDMHAWAITSGAPVFSAHVVVDADVFRQGATGRLLDELSACLTGHFDVEHSTFQLEPAEHAQHEDEVHQ